MRLLFLDDDEARQRWAKRVLGQQGQLTQVWDAPQCIKALGSGEWDQVFLDHDLGGEVHVDPSLPNTGSGVVRWVVQNSPKVGAFVVHSLNTPAAAGMVADLEDAGYEAVAVPFLRLITMVHDPRFDGA